MFKKRIKVSEEEYIEELKYIIKSMWKMNLGNSIVCGELKSRLKKCKIDDDMIKLMEIKERLNEIGKIDMVCWGYREEDIYQSVLELIYR